MSHIRLSPKHGVNPTLLKCFICGEDTNGLALLGRLPGDAKASRYMTMKGEWCESCTRLIREEDRVAFIQVRDGEKGDEPFRTGALAFLKMAVVDKHLSHTFADELRISRVCFMEESTWTQFFG